MEDGAGGVHGGPPAVNIILGRVSLVKFQAVISLHHFKLKFPTEDGVAEVCGHQDESRSCYAASLRRSEKRPLLMVGHTPDVDARPKDSSGVRDVF